MAPWGGIFISYRRGDAAGHAGRLYDRLREHFGAERIFIDVEAIEPGVDFVGRIEDAVGACEILLALIGRSWAAAAHPDGRRRLHDPADIVRLEIAAALRRHVPVIPVLVGAAEMPRPEELPDPLVPLARHNATRIDDDRFHHDADRLIAALDRLLGAEPATGQPAVVACPRCGTQNPGGARFCLACGSEVGEPAVGRREVRKTVTVVACAAIVAAGPGAALDPEPLRQVLAGYHGRTAEVIGRHGGTVVDASGETVVAVFGVPRLHEDDAVRAVRAAAEFRDDVGALAADLQAAQGVRFDLRIGVATGEVVVTDAAGQDVLVGDPVGLAARLARTAATGEILLAVATQRLARDAVTVEPVVPAADGAEHDPAAHYRLLAVSPGSPGHARRLDAPMVGRARELRLLAEALDRAVADRACHLFTVLGPAGVGKSRLMREFLSGLGPQAAVLRGRCLDYGEGITFWPVAEVVREAAGIGDSDDADTARSRLARLLAGEEHEAILVQRISVLLGLAEGNAAAEELGWAVRKLLEALGHDRPLVVTLDDLHWAEPTLLDVVRHVVDWTHDAPILLVCLARLELLDARPEWGGGTVNATSILLEPLTEPDSARLVDNLLGQVDGADALRARVLQTAEGNPLFVEELVSMLVDDGLLVRRDGDWAVTGELATVPVPPTIQALLAARLDRLGDQERTVLERGSVVGKVFYRGAVTELSPEPLRPTIPAHLMGLVRKELIRPDRSGFAGDDAFRFRHLLLRDAAYLALPKRERARLHERFATWLERMVGDRLAEYEEIIGYHQEQASRYLAELGPVDDHGRQLARLAGERLALVGRRANARGDLSAAIGFLTRAQDLLGAEAAGREVVVELGEALVWAGEFSRAEAVLTEALVAASGTEDRRLEAYVSVVRLQLQLMTGANGWNRRAREAAERAIATFEELRDDRGLAMAWTLLADVHWQKGQAARTVQSLERALVHAERAGDARRLVRCRAFLASALSSGPTPAAEAQRRCQGLDDQMRTAQSILGATSMAMLEAMQGRFQTARQLIVDSKRLAADLGRPMMVAAMAMDFGEVELLAGDGPAAERELRGGYEVLERFGEDYWRATVATLLAEAVYLQGRPDEAWHWTGVGHGLAAGDDVDAQVRWRAVRAKVLAGRGDHDTATRLAVEAVQLAQATDFLSLRGEALMGLAKVYRLGGRPAESAAALADALALYERKGNLVAAATARSALSDLSGSGLSGPIG
jgi:class 3 adenylate cyclase/tetratricopeptide (TPR) repeat protein